MKEELLSIIRKLKPKGEDGFEGLIKKLLENLTGLRFYFAKSAYQAGRDLDAIIDEGRIMTIECKRFSENTKLRRRELLGELEQASQATPFLDLWILVTTKQIDTLSRDQLLTKGEKENIEILFIDTENFHPYSLDLLFATGRNIVLKFIKKNLLIKE